MGKDGVRGYMDSSWPVSDPLNMVQTKNYTVAEIFIPHYSRKDAEFEYNAEVVYKFDVNVFPDFTTVSPLTSVVMMVHEALAKLAYSLEIYFVSSSDLSLRVYRFVKNEEGTWDIVHPSADIKLPSEEGEGVRPTIMSESFTNAYKRAMSSVEGE